MFDTFSHTAMYMDIDTHGMHNADQSKWVPLDIILHYWLRQIKKGRLYIESGSFKVCQYTKAEFAEDIKAWEELPGRPRGEGAGCVLRSEYV